MKDYLYRIKMFSGLETLSMGKRACIYDDEFRAKILFSCVSPGDGDRTLAKHVSFMV